MNSRDGACSPGRGRTLLFWGVGIYTVLIAGPLAWLLFTGNAGTSPFLGFVAAAWLLPAEEAGYAPYLGFVAAAIIHSPWNTLRGSNGSRTLAGILALLGAMISVPASCTVFFEDSRIAGIAWLTGACATCFLTNVFLLNRHVQACVSEVRARRGLDPNHWKIDSAG